MSINKELIITEIESGRTQAELAREYGVSRQRISQIYKDRNKPPRKNKHSSAYKSKKQLAVENEALIKENEKLAQQLDTQEQAEWAKLQEKAFEVFHKLTKPLFGNLVTNVKLEHTDKAGYWFSFELENDTRRQTFAVRHNEVSI